MSTQNLDPQTSALEPEGPHPSPDATQQIRSLQALVAAGISLAAEHSLEKVLECSVMSARRIVLAEYAALAVVAADDTGIERVLAVGSELETQTFGADRRVEGGILTTLRQEGRPVRRCGLALEAENLGFPLRYPAMRSFLGVPVRAGGRVFGLLLFAEKQGAHAFSEEEERLALDLAAQTGAAIENARALQEAREQQESLIAAARITTVNTLASIVGHELRNPLSVIYNAIYFLNTKVARDDARVARNLDIIRREIQAATQIMEHLLEFSRIRPPHCMPMDARGLVQDALERQPVPGQVQVENRVPAGQLRLYVDPTLMQQVMSQLLRNAVQAMPDGGTLSVDGEAGEGRITLRVRDTGEGIAPENRARIFEPLFTTRRGGIGLGLALVQRVVDAHQGQVRVASEVGQGTLVTLELPAA